MREKEVDYFKKVLEEMSAIHEKKNSDYDGAFEKIYEFMGIVYPMSRILEKVLRVISIEGKGQYRVLDESPRDTLVDIANYAVMLVAELDKKEEESVKCFCKEEESLNEPIKNIFHEDELEETEDELVIADMLEVLENKSKKRRGRPKARN